MFIKVSVQQCPNCTKPTSYLWISGRKKSTIIRCGHCMSCATHKTYTGVRRSKVGCPICQIKWNMMHGKKPLHKEQI